jgi:hypothetical protein
VNILADDFDEEQDKTIRGEEAQDRFAGLGGQEQAA